MNMTAEREPNNAIDAAAEKAEWQLDWSQDHKENYSHAGDGLGLQNQSSC